MRYAQETTCEIKLGSRTKEHWVLFWFLYTMQVADPVFFVSKMK